jgi:hypothetical protein
MTSPPPLFFDTYYHIYNRGINRGNIFFEERNYDLFLKLYERHLAHVTVLLAYCMLRNHFHLCLKTKAEQEIVEHLKTPKVSAPHPKLERQDPSAGQKDPVRRKSLETRTISDQFSNFFNAYAKSINKAYGRTGSLFQHPFGRVPITSDRQFWNVIAYIHQNPQKHGFVKDFRDWKYSSYGIILTEQRTVVNRSEVMKWFGASDDYLSLHSQWVTDAQAKWFAGDDED